MRRRPLRCRIAAAGAGKKFRISSRQNTRIGQKKTLR